MENNRCFLCNLVNISQVKSLKTLFEAEKHKDLENNFIKNEKNNAYTQLNSTKIKYESTNDANRSNNLIIFGIEESSIASDELQQQNNDRWKVKIMLMSIGLNANEEISEIKRLDQKRKTLKSRPILIKLEDKNTRSSILKKAKRLKDIDQYKNVSISPDYSKAKRLRVKLLIKTRIDLNKQLRAEKPDANYYFSIKSGRITMINKNSEQLQTNKTLNRKDHLEKLIDQIEQRYESRIKSVEQRISKVDLLVDMQTKEVEKSSIINIKINNQLKKTEKMVSQMIKKTNAESYTPSSTTKQQQSFQYYLSMFK